VTSAQALQRIQGLLRGVEGAQHLARSTEQFPSGLGEFETPSEPLEQGNAGLGLQFAQVHRHAGLRHVHLLRRARERPLGGHHFEHP